MHNAEDQGLSPAPAPGASSAPRGLSFWMRWLVVALIAGAFAAFFALDLQRYLSWESLQTHRAELEEYVAQHRALSVVMFITVYVTVAALSLPGAAMLSLTGGALFGRWLGTGIVCVASTTGATAALLATRYLLRDLVRDKWGGRLEPINRGIDENGPYYLLTLRLVPLFPFFLINAALGLTRMRVWTFWWVSLVGMLPGTFLYVNAGTELGRITSPRQILSPAVLVSLALLGVLPLAARLAVKWWRSKRKASQ